MLITPHSYANEQNVDNLNGILLICITKEQIFSFDADSEYVAVESHLWKNPTNFRLFIKVLQPFCVAYCHSL